MSFPWGTLVDYIEFNKIRGWPKKYGIFMQALETETFTVLILYGKEVTINSNIMEKKLDFTGLEMERSVS